MSIWDDVKTPTETPTPGSTGLFSDINKSAPTSPSPTGSTGLFSNVSAPVKTPGISLTDTITKPMAQSTPAVESKPNPITRGFNAVKDFFFKQEPITLQPAFNKPSEAVSAQGTKSMELAYNLLNRTPEFFAGLPSKVLAVAFPNHEIPTPFGIDAGRLSGAGGKEGDKKLQTYGQDYLDNWAEADAKAGLTGDRMTNPSNPLSLLHGTISAVNNVILPSLAVADVGVGIQTATKEFLAKSGFQSTLGLKYSELSDLRPEDFTRTVTNRTKEVFDNLVSDVQAGKITPQEANMKLGKIAREYSDLGNLYMERGRASGTYTLNPIGKAYEDIAIALNENVRDLGMRDYAPVEGQVRPAQETLPGYRPEPGQAPAMGMSTQKVEPVGFGEKPPVYKGETDLSTKILEDLKGKSTVSKQYILDATNRPELKQTEKDITRSVLNDFPDTVPVVAFAKALKAELLPLTRSTTADVEKTGEPGDTKYENVTLPENIRGNVADYIEHVYDSPVKTNAGQIHFRNSFGGDTTDNYFGHTRVEDMENGSTRRVIEVQSDLYQKGGLEKQADSFSNVGRQDEMKWYSPVEQKEVKGFYKAIETKKLTDVEKARWNKINENAKAKFAKSEEGRLAKLKQYNDPTAHFRMVREEIKKASEDGKTKLQFPTGATAMKIEGLGDTSSWQIVTDKGASGRNLRISDLELGKVIAQNGQFWIVTDLLGEGKFTAIQKTRDITSLKDYREVFGDEGASTAETFDISGKVDTNNPIYRFYEKDLGRYLTNKFGAKIITDSRGVTWYEVPIGEKNMGAVEAFKLSPEGRTRLRDGVKWTPEQAQDVVRQFFTPTETEFIPSIKPIGIGEGAGMKEGKIEGVAYRGYDPKTLQFRDFIKVLVEDGKVKDATVLHEVFEKAVQIALDDTKFRTVIGNIKTSPLSVFLRDQYSREAYPTRDLRAKELLADDFAEYVRDKAGYKGENAGLWEQLLQFIRKLWRKWTGAEQLYEDLMAGKRMKNVENVNDMGQEYGLSAEETPPRKVGEVKIGDTTVDVNKGGQMELPVKKGLQEEPGPATNLRPIKGPPTPDEGMIRNRTASQEMANKQYLREAKKTAEADLPKKEVIEIRRKENEIRTAYGGANATEANNALGQIINEMDVAEKGSRTMIGSGPDARFIANPSTFPKWLANDLKSRKLFDKIIQKVDSIQTLHYPDRTVSLREAKLIDTIFNQIDERTGIDTSKIRAGITNQYTSEGRLQAKDDMAVNRFLEKGHRETARVVNTEEIKKQHLERVKKAEEESAKKMAEEQLYKTTLQEKINQAHSETKVRGNIFTRTWNKIQATLKPTEILDTKTKELTKAWLDRKDAITEIANEEYRKSVPLGPQNFQQVIDFQAGKQTPYIKEAFDSMGTEFQRRGLDFSYIEDYVPQVWREADGKFIDIASKYLKEKGLTDEEIKAYLAGRTMAPTQALRLKVRPNFVKERFFPDYVTGMARGLKPKYWSPAQLMAYYRQQGETSLNNKDYIDTLKSEAKLLPVEDAPDIWEPVSLRFSREGLYARPELARLLNGVFRDGDNLALIPWVTQKFSRLARFMFDMRTMAGIPNTTVNSFAIGQANRLVVSALGNLATLDLPKVLTDLKASFAFIRANSNTLSARWFDQNKEFILKMADQGIAPGQYPGSYQTVSRTVADVLTDVSSDTNFLGKVFNTIKNTKARAVYFFWKWVNDKTMKSMMAQINVQIYKDTYQQAMASGIEEENAAKFAGDVTKKFNGLIGNVGRSPGTSEGLQAAFTAPYFRESVIATLFNGFKGGSTEFRNPVYSRSRKFILGLIISYGIYNALNKELNGNWMWENPPGHEFQLRIPFPNKDVVYVTYMPSFLAIARNIGSAAINIGTGHFDVATQKIGSLFSTPIELLTEIWANKDYFGRAIYKITDSADEKIQKIATYVGLSANHPFISESVKFVLGQQPLYQAISRMMELPLTFSTFDKEQIAKYYDMIAQKTQARADAKKSMQPTYDKLQKMKADGDTAGANKIYFGLSKEDKKVYDGIKADAKRGNTMQRKPIIQGIYDSNQDLKKTGHTQDAQNIYLNLSADDRRIYDNIKQADTSN